MLHSGLNYVPVYDNLMGVFCWMRKEDQETTLWETGQDAQECLEFVKAPRTPWEIDDAARLAFAAEGLL